MQTLNENPTLETDAQEYGRLAKELSELLEPGGMAETLADALKNPNRSAFRLNEVWDRIEEIKNDHGGYLPGTFFELQKEAA